MDQDREQRIQKYREQSERADELQTGGDEEEASQLRAQGLEAARANGDEDYGLFFEAELACAAGNHSTAIALLHKSIELVSLTGGGDYFLLRNMGVYHAFNGEPGVAIEWYEKALEANPEDYRAMCGTGHAVSMSGDLDVAIEWFNSALKIAPDYDRCFQGLSMCALLQGKLEEAVDNVTLAARSAPRAQRANFYFVLGAAGLLPEVAWRDLAIAEVEAPLTKKVELSELSGFIYQIRRAYAGQTKEFLKKKAEAEEAKRKFLLPNSDLDPERSVMLLLRRWNSYTPAVPGTK
ncbi:MAG: tetratricopeptide repeat protein, partial [Armatimonadia bacterium]